MKTTDIVRSSDDVAAAVPSMDRECVKDVENLYLQVRRRLALSFTCFDDAQHPVLVEGSLLSESIDELVDEAHRNIADLESAWRVADSLIMESRKAHGPADVFAKACAESLRNLGAIIGWCEQTHEVESTATWGDPVYQKRMEFVSTLLKMTNLVHRSGQTGHDRDSRDGVE